MELRDYLVVLRRRMWIVLLAGLLVGGVAFGLSVRQSPVYQASARLLIGTSQTVFESGRQTPGDVQTEIERLRSVPVQDAVRDKIGGQAPPVSAIQVGTTQVMQLTTEARTSRQAADFANAYADAYITYRVTQAVDQFEKAVVPVQARLDSIEAEIRPLQEAIQAAPIGRDRDAKNIELGPRINALLSVQTTFKSTLDKLQVDAALKSGGVELVAPAAVPRSPVRPTPTRNGLLGLAVGLIFGTALAFVFEHLDDSIKGKDDLERALPGLPVLGLIPLIPDWKAKEDSRLISIIDPTSPPAEAYRILRTSLQFLGLDTKVRLIQITSPNAQEGKTTTLSNLAVAFSSAGLRTIVVDCDLRRPRLHQFFGVSNEIGFTSVLVGTSGLAKALQPVPGQERLLVLASGPLPPNPSELLSSQRTADLLHSLSSQADVVLIDSPPSLPVTDASVLSQLVDSTVLVTTAGGTTRKVAGRAVEMLQQVGAPLVGVVLNGVTTESGYGTYSYQYGTVAQSALAMGNGNGAAKSTNGNGSVEKRQRKRRTRNRT